MKYLAPAIILALILSLSFGCGVNQYTANTEVSFKNGEWYYKSNKNQQDLKAEIGTDANGKPFGKIQTTSATPESAIAAALSGLLYHCSMEGKKLSNHNVNGYTAACGEARILHD